MNNIENLKSYIMKAFLKILFFALMMGVSLPPQMAVIPNNNLGLKTQEQPATRYDRRHSKK